MTVLDVVTIFAAGLAAGTINTIVGSGSLVTFPALIALGYPALSANVSNNVGLLAGSLTGTWSYRHEIRKARHVVWQIMPAVIVGALTGALALVLLPESVFDTVVPVLVGLAVVLVIAQPRISKLLAARRVPDESSGVVGVHHLPTFLVAITATSIYGGYFGAAQGVLLMGLFGVLLTSGSIQDQNGLKNLVAGTVNLIAGIVFFLVVREHISWPAVGLIAAGSGCGGFLGAWVGRRLQPTVFRTVIVVVGVVAIVMLVTP